VTGVGKKVLIVDDDNKLRKLLKEYLEGAGFQVLGLADGASVMKTIAEESPDMVILDIMLPKKSGLELLKEVRQKSGIPVIMLTARGEEADRVIGLELGADDYLPKPFSPRELMARINAVLRRSGPEGRSGKAGDEDMFLRVGDLVLNKARQILVREGSEIPLSSTEYRLLKVMMENPNRILSRDQLMSLARGKDFMAFDRSIDVHVSKLRAKLETDSRSPRYIKTIWGTGYMFVDSP
jgi:two-component system, OmpR family, phosphate regulon response regulator OmpR